MTDPAGGTGSATGGHASGRIAEQLGVSRGTCKWIDRYEAEVLARGPFLSPAHKSEAQHTEVETHVLALRAERHRGAVFLPVSSAGCLDRRTHSGAPSGAGPADIDLITGEPVRRPAAGRATSHYYS